MVVADHKDEKLLQIEGRSGCSLKIFIENNKFIVRKTSSHKEYNGRLEKQWLKQQKFTDKELNKIGFFTPAVYKSGNDELLHWFDMEYINGQKYSNYLIKLNKSEINAFVSKLVSYFDYLLKNSTVTETPYNLILNKVADLKTQLVKNKWAGGEFCEKVINYLQQVPSSKIYIGKCHGDFTFSNMLFLNNGNIFLFDLLDTFIDSPFLDFVKLRQDTFFHWSVFIEDKYDYPNYTKLIQILYYIDKKVSEYMSSNELFTEWQNYLTVFNLARIIPYVSGKKESDFVCGNIKKILN